MRRQAFLSDGAEPRIADAAAAALLKAWAASKPDAAQAAAAGSALAESLDAGLLNVVAAYLPPRGEAVLGSSAAAFAAEVLPRLAAKASTGDAALDKLATPLLIAAALTAPVSPNATRSRFRGALVALPATTAPATSRGGSTSSGKDVGRLSPSALADVKAAWGAPRWRTRSAGVARWGCVPTGAGTPGACGPRFLPPPSHRRWRRSGCRVRSAVPQPRRQRSRRRCAGASAGAPPKACSGLPFGLVGPPNISSPSTVLGPAVPQRPDVLVVARPGGRLRQSGRSGAGAAASASSSSDESSEEDVPTPAPRLWGVPFA